MREVPRAAQIKKAILDHARRTWAIYAVLPGDAPKGQAMGPVNATTNLAQIGQWLEQTPTMGVGLATGVRHGFVAVVTEGRVGADALTGLADRHGGLPSTPFFDDAGDKRVRIFKLPCGQLACNSRTLAAHVLLVGDGSGVTLPTDPEDFPVWCLGPSYTAVAELPLWLLEATDEGDRASGAASAVPTTSLDAEVPSTAPTAVGKERPEPVEVTPATTTTAEADVAAPPPTTAANDDVSEHAEPAAEPTGLQVVPIDAIQIGKRHRQDLGDVDSLAASITQVGLLHPPAVTADLRLVAGARRVAAVRQLGWAEVPVVIVHDLSDATRALQAERDENSCRQPLTPSEAVALASALEALERPRAQERQRKHGGTAPGRPKNTQGKMPRVSPEPKTRKLVAGAVGFGERTLDKAKAVVKAGNAEPEKFAEVVATMDRTGNVDAAYQAVRGKRREAKDDASARPAGLRDRGADADTLIVQRPATDGEVTELAERLVKFLGPTGSMTLSVALHRRLAKPGVTKSPRARTKAKPGRKRSTRQGAGTKRTRGPVSTKRMPSAVDQGAIDLFD